MIRRVLIVILLIISSVFLSAQNSTPSNATATFPRLIRYSGTLLSKKSSLVGVTFAFYREETGGAPLWVETQNVQVDENGHFSALLGSTKSEGVPMELFVAGQPRWIGAKPESQNALPRVLLISVPYALKAGDAETLRGLPPSAFVQSSGSTRQSSMDVSASTAGGIPQALQTNASTGTQNYLAKWLDATTLGNSTILDTGTNVGLGTVSPLATLHVQGPNAEELGQKNANGALLIQGAGTFAASMGTKDDYIPGHQYFWIQSRYMDNAIFRNLVLNPSGGNVGVHTRLPLAQFHIQGPNSEELSQKTANGAVLIQGAGTFAASMGTKDDYVAGHQYFWIQSRYVDNAIFRHIVLNPSGGNVGIGTTAPSSKLSVAGTIESTSGGFKFPDGSILGSAINIPTVTTSVNYTGSTGDQILKAVQKQPGNPESKGFNASGVPSGLRGDSTTTTGYAAGVFGSASSPLAPGVAGINVSSCPAPPAKCNAYGVFGWSVIAINGAGVWGQADAVAGASNVGVYGESKGDAGTGVEGYANNSASGDGTGVYGLTNAPNGAGVWGDSQATTGSNIGVYGSVSVTTGVAGQFDSPTNGTILLGRSGGASKTKVFRVDSTGKGFFNGGTQTGGADFAESVDVLGDPAQYEPGDVLMIDETGHRRLSLATGAYSTKVAGIYSTKPGVLATPHTMEDPQLANEVPLAIVGIVPCKVSAENGAIHAGDLLVTSTRPGYAMKGTEVRKMMGAVLGKALGSLDRGTGVIEVLVSLH